jgi:folate-binding protein YgfZ
MGVRVVCAEGSLEIEDEDIKQDENLEEYNLMRHLLGILEGS